APRLDLANEDLVRSHVHAIWLAETGQDLGGSLTDILDASGDKPRCGLLPQEPHLVDSAAAGPRGAPPAKNRPAAGAAVLQRAPWWRTGWIGDAVREAPAAFDAACDRWRELYRLALTEFQLQSARSVDSSLKHADRNIAAGRARDARVQLNLLANEGSD